MLSMGHDSPFVLGWCKKKYLPVAAHVKGIVSGLPAGPVKQFTLPAPLYVALSPTQILILFDLERQQSDLTQIVPFCTVRDASKSMRNHGLESPLAAVCA